METTETLSHLSVTYHLWSAPASVEVMFTAFREVTLVDWHA